MKWDSNISICDVYKYLSSRSIEKSIGAYSMLDFPFTYFIIKGGSHKQKHDFVCIGVTPPKSNVSQLIVKSVKSMNNHVEKGGGLRNSREDRLRRLATPFNKSMVLNWEGKIIIDPDQSMIKMVKEHELTSSEYLTYLDICNMKMKIEKEILGEKNVTML